MRILQYPDLTYSKYAYDCRRGFVAGYPGVFKLLRRYSPIVWAFRYLNKPCFYLGSHHLRVP